MKTVFTLLILTSIIYSQDKIPDGRFGNQLKSPIPAYINGNSCNCDVLHRSQMPIDNLKSNTSNEVVSLSFPLFWSSPSGAFSNCNDGWAGYLENDTLLDLVGYTFNPNKLYIWEQVPTNPDSFALIYTYTKVESGGFGPIAVGDIDGDGKNDIIVSDFSLLSRIYIISNTGPGTFVSRETQNTLTSSEDGTESTSLLIGDLNKNGQKEIILTRGWSSPTSGSVTLWEHNGSPGSFTFNKIYTYSTVSYLFGKSGIGDGENTGWPEVYLTYGGYDTYNTNIRSIKYDSATSTFQAQIFSANAIGIPSSYKIYDLYNNGHKELIATESSNNRAAVYIYKSIGANQYQTVDSIFETSDPNTMMSSDIKILTGDTYPTILAASFASNIYMYQYNGTHYVKQYQNITGYGSATYRVYWLPWAGYDGFFQAWSSSNSTGEFYLYKRDILYGIENQGSNVYKFNLFQNYPNPFNPAANINYEIPSDGIVKIIVYDVTGKEISKLADNFETRGIHNIQFDGSNFASGIYFYQIQFGDKILTKKMILVK